MAVRVHWRDRRGTDEGMQRGAPEDVQEGYISCVGWKVHGRKAGWGAGL